MQDLRTAIANTIDRDNFRSFLRHILEDYAQFTPQGSTKLSPSTTLAEIKDIVKTPGPGFQGSDLLVRWFVKSDRFFKEYNIGIIMFSHFGPGFTAVIGGDNCKYYICLHNHPNTHWSLANIVIARNQLTCYIDNQTFKAIKRHL
jgi:hypothetical protein